MEVTELKTHLDAGLAAIREQVSQVNTEITTAFEKRLEEVKKNGVADPETKEKIERLYTRQDQLEAKLDHAMSSSNARMQQVKTVASQVLDTNLYTDWVKEEFRTKAHQRWAIDGSLFPYVEGKAVLESGLSSATTGVMGIDRIPEILNIIQRQLRIRDLLPVFPTTAAAVDFLRQSSFTNAASPQVEGSLKAESTLAYDTITTAVRTVAHFIKVSTQALSDIPQLRADIDDLLMYGLKLKEEDEILNGSGTGQHLNGIITQATAYASGTYNVAADTKLDKVRHFILQARLALYPVDGLVMNPRDLHDIDLVKTNNGGANTGSYIIGDPRSGTAVTMLWGKPVVESDSIAYGSMLAGAFRFGARLYDRLKATIDISLEDSDNFEKNLATIRAEERLALAVTRPGAFVYGAF